MLIESSKLNLSYFLPNTHERAQFIRDAIILPTDQNDTCPFETYMSYINRDYTSFLKSPHLHLFSQELLEYIKKYHTSMKDIDELLNILDNREWVICELLREDDIDESIFELLIQNLISQKLEDVDFKHVHFIWKIFNLIPSNRISILSNIIDKHHTSNMWWWYIFLNYIKNDLVYNISNDDILYYFEQYKVIHTDTILKEVLLFNISNKDWVPYIKAIGLCYSDSTANHLWEEVVGEMSIGFLKLLNICIQASVDSQYIKVLIETIIHKSIEDVNLLEMVCRLYLTESYLYHKEIIGIDQYLEKLPKINVEGILNDYMDKLHQLHYTPFMKVLSLIHNDHIPNNTYFIKNIVNYVYRFYPDCVRQKCLFWLRHPDIWKNIEFDWELIRIANLLNIQYFSIDEFLFRQVNIGNLDKLPSTNWLIQNVHKLDNINLFKNPIQDIYNYGLFYYEYSIEYGSKIFNELLLPNYESMNDIVIDSFYFIIFKDVQYIHKYTKSLLPFLNYPKPQITSFTSGGLSFKSSDNFWKIVDELIINLHRETRKDEESINEVLLTYLETNVPSSIPINLFKILPVDRNILHCLLSILKKPNLKLSIPLLESIHEYILSPEIFNKYTEFIYNDYFLKVLVNCRRLNLLRLFTLNFIKNYSKYNKFDNNLDIIPRLLCSRDHVLFSEDISISNIKNISNHDESRLYLQEYLLTYLSIYQNCEYLWLNIILPILYFIQSHTYCLNPSKPYGVCPLPNSWQHLAQRQLYFFINKLLDKMVDRNMNNITIPHELLISLLLQVTQTDVRHLIELFIYKYLSLVETNDCLIFMSKLLDQLSTIQISKSKFRNTQAISSILIIGARNVKFISLIDLSRFIIPNLTNSSSFIRSLCGYILCKAFDYHKCQINTNISHENSIDDNVITSIESNIKNKIISSTSDILSLLTNCVNFIEKDRDCFNLVKSVSKIIDNLDCNFCQELPIFDHLEMPNTKRDIESLLQVEMSYIHSRPIDDESIVEEYCLIDNLIDKPNTSIPKTNESCTQINQLKSIKNFTKSRPNQRIHIIASFVTKPVNIAGICRTAEVFGAYSVYVDNKQKLLSDYEFKNVCVSSDHLIDICELNREKVNSFLNEKYSSNPSTQIVALEQTNASTEISLFEWNGDDVFILVGDEKYGVPIDTLSICTNFIEIPQYGLIRSLNVHVSTAIAIWECVR